MDNNDLRLQVAKALSGGRASWWSIHQWGEIDTTDKLIGVDFIPCTMGGEVMLPDDKGDAPTMLMMRETLEHVPDWPNDWNAAMELVKIAQADPYGQALQISRVPAMRKTWVCRIGNFAEPGDTGPEAICRAWLAWKGANDGKAS